MTRSLQSGFVTLLTVALIIFQHFQIGEFSSYPVTVGLIVGTLLLVVSSVRLPLSRLLIVVTIVCLPNALVQIAAPSVRDGYASFFGTFALFVLASFIVTQFSSSTVRPSFAQGATRGMITALLLVVLLSVVQVVTGSRGSLLWFNLFGEHQYLYQYNPHLEFNPVPRAEALYLEPSYAAFIVGSLAVGLVAARRHVIAAWSLGAVGMLAIRSATGLLIFAAVAVVALFVSRSRWRIPAFTGLLGASLIAVPYLAGRLDSTFTPGTSAYYRLIGPLQILQDTLVHFPLGHPFGSLRNTVADYGILNGAAAGDSLDNGFYVIVFYFGWAGVVASGVLVFWALRRVVLANRAVRPGPALVAVWSVGSLFFSGGVMLPEFLLTLWLLFAAQHSSQSAEALRIEALQNDLSLDRHDHLQRR